MIPRLCIVPAPNEAERLTAGDRPDAVRRGLLRAIAGSLFAAPVVRARAAVDGPIALNAPQQVAQIHASAADRLLAVTTRGSLFEYAGGKWAERAKGLDPGAPIANGHGRVAGRSDAGTLWVLEDGRTTVERGPTIAPHAGLRILPFGVIAVSLASDGAAHVVRLEPATASGWAQTARSHEPVLPDARPLQISLEGGPGADAGHIVAFAGPDSQRYRHGVLGDATEPTRLLYFERHGLDLMRSLSLPAPYVFEDLAPRPVAWRGRHALLTVRAGPQGAQLAVVAPDDDVRGALALVALGPPIGTVNRWMSPITNGRQLLAVHTPHVGGVLHEYRIDSGRLSSRPLAAGLSNHALGSRELDLAAWVNATLVVPSTDRRTLRAFNGERAWSEQPLGTLSSPVMASRSLRRDRRLGCALLLEDGTVWWTSPG